MLKRVLIANRGEIALRILRACREMGIDTVAVYSQADAEALHVQLAGQAVCIGPARAADSYLNQNALLTVATATGCDGVHPGYGFLSENADFADACAAAGLTFIGPSGDTIRKAGSKSAARDIMRAAAPSPLWRTPWPPRKPWATRCCSRPAPAAADGVSAAVTGPRTCPPPTPRPRRRPRPASATTRCTWKSWCWAPGISSSRSWQTATAMSSIWGTGTALCSAATRSSSKKLPPGA